MITTVAFDVDGVLVDSQFAAVLHAELGVTLDHTAAFFGGPFLDCLEGRADTLQALAPYLPAWGWEGSAEAFLSMWIEVDSQTNSPALEFARTIEAAGYRCVVASNQEPHRARRMRNLLEGFSEYFFSCELGCRKPQPAFFETLRKRLGLPAHELLLIDDQMTNVAAARVDGWHAAHYDIGQQFSDLATAHCLRI